MGGFHFDLKRMLVQGGHVMWHLQLGSSSPDTGEVIEAVGIFQNREEARNLGSFWVTGGHQMVRTCFQMRAFGYEPDNERYTDADPV